MAFTKPSAAVGSPGSRSPATMAPAHPPTPDSTATYCLPSGPLYVIGWPMIPEPDLVLPQQICRFSHRGFEPSVHRAVEDDVGRRDERAAPHRKVLFHRPDFLRVDRIPSAEDAAVAAGAGVHLDVRADVRRSLRCS